MSEELKCNKCGVKLTGSIDIACQRHVDYAGCIENLVKQLAARQKELAEAKLTITAMHTAIETQDEEIERLKSLLIPYGDAVNVKNNLCRCCGLIMSDEEKQNHNCGKEPVIRN